MSAISWEDALGVSGSMSRGGKIDFDKLFLRPKAPAEKGTDNKYVVKVLQKPHPYVIHWANKNDEDGKRLDVPFFDAEFSNKATRNCHRPIIRTPEGKFALDKSVECPWCKAGYNTQLKYMFNVYCREMKILRIADVNDKVVDEIGKRMKEAKLEGEVLRPEDWENQQPDFIFTAARDSAGGKKFGGGGVTYSATPTRKSHGITKEVVDAIAEANPDAADQCEDVLDYRKYLYNLDKWTSPTPVATAEDAAGRRSSNLEVEEDEDSEEVLNIAKKAPKVSLKDDEDDEEEVTVVKKSSKKPVVVEEEDEEVPVKKSSKKPVVEEDEDDEEVVPVKKSSKKPVVDEEDDEAEEDGADKMFSTDDKW